MNKTYLIISPFSKEASHGIHNYNLNLLDYLDKKGIKTDYFTNDDNLSFKDFRIAVYNYVTQNYGIEEVIIEAPEVKASTLLLTDYDVKIRVHTPGAIAQKYDYKEIDQDLFAYELQVINQSKYVSSPSYGIINELKNYIRRNDISYYKNPFNNNIEMSSVEEKEYDLMFMSRFQPLKGTEYINNILLKLPKNYNVLLMGNKATKFNLNPNIECNVTIMEGIDNEERFNYVKKSKVLMQLSNFENCSMVILESLSCGTVCCAWDVGGNNEIAEPPLLKTTKKGDIDSFVKMVTDTVENEYPSQKSFLDALETIHKDFEDGFDDFLKNQNNIFKGMDLSDKHLFIETFKELEEKPKSLENFGERIFGFSISNEHIEEMWMPVIEKFNADYKFVCKRPLGFMYKFNNPFYVDPNKYIQFDWMTYPNLLIKEIEKFKPNKILFHNGIHPMYQTILNRVKKAFPKIPIVYTELGWFPQQDNIYFDEWGTNGKSQIASLKFEDFCNKEYPRTKRKKKVKGDHVLIVTQLENDTNLIVNSRRFKKMDNFVSYVLSQLDKNEKVIIKTHPLDNKKERFEVFQNENVEVIHEGDLNKLLENSKAVIGINSTVLLEALKYETNVYMFGDYLLNNKKVVIECGVKDQLKDLWTDYYYSNREAKDIIIEEFKNRQINVKELNKYSVSELLNKKAFFPVLNKKYKYSKKEEFEILENRLNPSFVKKESNVFEDIIKEHEMKIEELSKRINKKESSSFQKKIKKLYKNPKLFFKDSKFKIFRKISKVL